MSSAESTFTAAPAAPATPATIDTNSSRKERDLIGATKPFAQESVFWSHAHLFSSLALLGGTLTVAALVPTWWLRLPAVLIGAGLIVRNFIIYHDAMHGAILRRSAIGRAIMYAYGVWVLNPPRVWKQTHNYHHAHTAKIVGSNIGSYAMMTVEMWKAATPSQRLMYRITRHPLTIACGYITIFMFGMCLSSFLRNPKKHWDSLLSLVVQGAQIAALWIFLGPAAAFYGLVLPMFIACGAGAYLFYAQHNYPEMTLQPRDEWSYTRASLESSSYMEMGPLGRFFCGNIGFHHVHHLNPTIPFYRLPEAMAALPELQHPGKTSWGLGDMLACFRLKLWDPEQGKMVGYPS